VPYWGMDLDHDACYRAIAVRDARFDGRLFTGVKTTGIYCRPICPARTPRSENVAFYPTAAAAQEAGFRPCLRCRPETAPDLGAWRGASTLSRGRFRSSRWGRWTMRALTPWLVELGSVRASFAGYFTSTSAPLRSRSPRLGGFCSPKQLIHETHLPMTEIAMAAGFGSLRRFNETFLALFRRPPTALRRAVGADVTAGVQGEVSLLLRYRPPYDWPAMLGFLRVRAIAGVESVEGGVYRRTIGLDGLQGTVAVRPTDGGRATGDRLLSKAIDLTENHRSLAPRFRPGGRS
jgi:AraC family transcriptional regulator, regulatory protein of adaptative response / DNA-3-methyladenine glycosylase II